MEKNCGTCKFWSTEHIDLIEPENARNSDIGECIRNPPQIIGAGPANITLTCDLESARIIERLTRFPVTSCVSRCGEWQENKYVQD